MPNEITDEEKQNRVEEFVRNNLKDRDDIDFDFEADLEKAIKKLNVRRIVDGDIKYLRRFTAMIARMYEKIYLEDTIKAGRRQSDRFKRLFGGILNAN